MLFWPRHATHWKDQLPVWTVCQDGATSSRFLACDSKVFSSLRKRDARPVFAQGAWPARARCGPRGTPARQTSGRAHALRAAAVRSGRGQRGDCVRLAVGVAGDASGSVQSGGRRRGALDAFGPRVVVVGNDLTLEGRRSVPGRSGSWRAGRGADARTRGKEQRPACPTPRGHLGRVRRRRAADSNELWHTQ